MREIPNGAEGQDSGDGSVQLFVATPQGQVNPAASLFFAIILDAFESLFCPDDRTFHVRLIPFILTYASYPLFIVVKAASSSCATVTTAALLLLL